MKPVEILIRLTAMGDVLLAVPTARALLSQGTSVHWVLHRRWAAMAEFLPATVHLVQGLSEALPLARRLRSLDPLRVHDLQGKGLSAFLAWAIRRPSSRYAKRPWAESVKAALGRYPLRNADPSPVWRRYLLTAGCEESHPDPSLVLSPSYLQDCDRAIRNDLGLSPGSIVAIHPGPSHPGKVLPGIATAEILARLPFPSLLIGDRADQAFPRASVDGRGRIPLRLLPGVLSRSRGLITTDSGPMHLGRAVNIPLVAIFLQTDPSLGFAPIPGSNLHLISRSLPCKPCSLHGQRAQCPEGTWACRDLNWSQEIRKLVDFLGAAQ